MIPFQDCSEEKSEEIIGNWIRTKGEIRSEAGGTTVQCLNMEGTYLKGDPDTKKEASLAIGLKPNQNFVDSITDTASPDKNLL